MYNLDEVFVISGIIKFTSKINCFRCDNAFFIIFFKTMYNKTIMRFGFCDVKNNQGLGWCYQPQPLALADNTCVSAIKIFFIVHCSHHLSSHWLKAYS